MSDNSGGWDRWEGWVPGDPVPSDVRPEGVRDRAAHLSPSDRTGSTVPGRRSAAVTMMAGVVVVLVVIGGAAIAVLLGAGRLATSDDPFPGSGSADVVPWEDDTDVVTEATVVGSMAGTAPLDLVRIDLSPLLVDLDGVVGAPHRLRRLVVYPGYAVADVEPPDEPGQVDVWVLYPGRASGPTPQRDVGDIEDRFFAASDLDTEFIAGLYDAAVEQTGVSDADQPYLIIERHASGGGAVTVAVYLGGARTSAWVRYGADGEVLSASTVE